MCGIAGFIAQERIDFQGTLKKMGQAMHHRGPDDKGIFFDEDYGVGLSHARLSIIDLSENGHQPMFSFSGRYVVVYNGEIYNHLEIRRLLEKDFTKNWRGSSDTETVLASLEVWGLEKTVTLLTGMFAIALYDREEKALYLIRDRMGEKPLYYGYAGKNFVFGSELGAIKSFPSFNNPISPDSVALFMRHGAIPDPYSIYDKINKLQPGHFLKFDLQNSTVTTKEYWSTSENYKKNQQDQFKGSEEEAVRELDRLLKQAVSLQMHSSDVPIGSFLSGGVDSSLISALMQSLSDSPINTFSIGFDVPAYNEAEFAKAVAKHLGTKHHEQYVTGKDALEVVPKLFEIYEEPFSESSQIPTFLVSKIAKQNVTVCLSGDAGDELFGGYERYRLANSVWNKVAKIPYILRSFAGSAIEKLPYDFWYGMLKPLSGFKNTGKPINYADKLVKALGLLHFDERKSFYGQGFMTHNVKAEQWVLNSKQLSTVFTENDLHFPSFYDEMMAIDQVSYLPNNNLVKVDRAAMANSLETRVPMLDHRVVNFAQSLPVDYKIRNGKMKWILRQVLYQYVPENLIERPKMGFGVPLAQWLRNDLKDWAENLLDEKVLKEQQLFNAELVRQYWDEHQSGKRNWENYLWDVLVFQSWLEYEKK